MQHRKQTDKQNETARIFMKCGHETALYPCCGSEPESMAWVSQYADANMVKTESFEGYSTIPAKSMALMNNL